MYSSKNVYRRIGEMIRSGDIANMLIKPTNFVLYIFAEECANIVQLSVNAFFGIVLGIAFAGVIEITIIQAIFVIVAVILAVIIQILLQILIGLIAFFTEENKAFYLVLSKLQLLIILAPLEFYPTIMQKIFYFSPTTYSIYVPSKLLVHFDITKGFQLLGLEIIGFLIIVGVISVLYKKGVKKINVNGG